MACHYSAQDREGRAEGMTMEQEAGKEGQGLSVESLRQSIKHRAHHYGAESRENTAGLITIEQ